MLVFSIERILITVNANDVLQNTIIKIVFYVSTAIGVRYLIKDFRFNLNN